MPTNNLHASLPLPSKSKPASAPPTLRSSLISRNITIDNHRTSIRLEPDMWNGLREICRREHTSMHDICTAIGFRKPAVTSLTAAIRVFVMAYFRAAATEDGHSKAGHGPGGHFMVTLKHLGLSETRNGVKSSLPSLNTNHFR